MEKHDPEDIANEINNYFIEIGSKLSGQIAPSSLNLDLNRNENYDKLTLSEITVEDIEMNLKKYRTLKLQGMMVFPFDSLNLPVS